MSTNDNKKDKKPKRFALKKGAVITPLPKTNSAAKQRKCLLYKLLLRFKIKSPFFKGYFRQSCLNKLFFCGIKRCTANKNLIPVTFISSKNRFLYGLFCLIKPIISYPTHADDTGFTSRSFWALLVLMKNAERVISSFKAYSQICFKSSRFKPSPTAITPLCDNKSGWVHCRFICATAFSILSPSPFKTLRLWEVFFCYEKSSLL